MWFLLILILGILALALWMWKRPDPVHRDQAKAVGHDLWLEQLDAQLKYAERLMADVPADYARAYELYQNMAKQHEIPEAYLAMGQMHLQGLGRDVSFENAQRLLEKAFSLGSDEAAYVLGQMAEGQYGASEKIIEKAQYWYRHAVARGNLDAQYRLAELDPQDQMHVMEQQLDLLKKNAEQGHANSQYQLAQHYLNRAEPNISLGLEYLLEAAQQDHLAALHQLQQMYQQGQYFPQNQHQALTYLKRGLLLGDQQYLYDYYQAVLQGQIDIDQRQRVYHDLLQQAREHKIAVANRLLGIAHFHGWYLEKKETLGFRFLTEAANEQDVLAIGIIAALYLEKYLVSDDPQKTYELMHTAHQIRPQFLNQVGLALCYFHGIGISQNIAKAQQLLAQAASEELNMQLTCVADQNYVIGRMYALAEFPLPTREKCLGYLNKAMEQGSKDAAWYVYRVYAEHLIFDVEADPELAYYALVKAVKFGHRDALTQLGIIHLEGQLQPQDLAEAFSCLSDAAHKGDPVAMYNMGQMYEQGLGVEKDLIQALDAYQNAAKLMNADASSRLGYFYIHGISVTRDLKVAQQYLQKAALQGHVEAQEQLENIYAFLNVN